VPWSSRRRQEAFQPPAAAAVFASGA